MCIHVYECEQLLQITINQITQTSLSITSIFPSKFTGNTGIDYW